jgi:hypothetical protein
LVERADVIVIAVAREFVSKPVAPVPNRNPGSSLPPLPPSPFQLTPPPPSEPFPNGNPHRSDRIRFEITDVLKGEGLRTLLIEGRPVEGDDFNYQRVPLNIIRRGGDAECYALTYRLGAAYLLLLQTTTNGELSPYWSPLSRLNDQILPGRDPWLEWVRQRVAERPASR